MDTPSRSATSWIVGTRPTVSVYSKAVKSAPIGRTYDEPVRREVGDADSEPVSPVSRRLALLVAAALFMEILDGTVIAPAAPYIAADLGVAPVDVNVAISAYVLTLAVLIPISGWLADRFGVRTVFSAAIAVFTLDRKSTRLNS